MVPSTPSTSRLPAAGPMPTTGGGRPCACCPSCGVQLPCQLCGLSGHITSRCHRRFKQDFLGIGNNGKGNDKPLMSMDTLHHILSTRHGTWIRALLITSRVRWASSPLRSHIVVMIKFAPPTEQVCTYHMLVRLRFLLINLNNYIFSMSFEFLPLHVVCCLFLGLLVIIMFSSSFIRSIVLSRTGTRGTFFLEVACAIDFMPLMCRLFLRLSAVCVCHLLTGTRYMG